MNGKQERKDTRKRNEPKYVWATGRGWNLSVVDWLAHRNDPMWHERLPISRVMLMEVDFRRDKGRTLVEIEIAGNTDIYHSEEHGEQLVLRNGGQTLVLTARVPPRDGWLWRMGRALRWKAS